MDLAEEAIAASHLKAGVVCAACHGPSEAHRSDEPNVITPDASYGRREIEPFCKSCRPSHPTGGAYDAFVEKWQGRRRPNGRMVVKDSVCTDCHGRHAILRPEQQVSG